MSVRSPALVNLPALWEQAGRGSAKPGRVLRFGTEKNERIMQRKFISILLLVNFVCGVFMPYSQAQVLPYMPDVGQMIMPANSVYSLPYITGMRFKSDNPFDFTFILSYLCKTSLCWGELSCNLILA